MEILITPISVSFLTQALILAALAGYFFVGHWLPRRRPFDLHHSLFIFFHFLYTFFGALEQGLYGGWDIVALFSQDVVLFFGSVFFVLSAYHYSLGNGLWKKEKKWVYLYILIFATQEGFVYYERYWTLFYERKVNWRSFENELLLPITYFWAVIVYYRQSLSLVSKHDNLKGSQRISWLSKVAGAILELFRYPNTRELRAARLFAGAALIPGVVAVIEMLGDRILLEVLIDPLIAIGVMLTIIVWVLTYINHISENSSYKTKFLGISMILFLMAINLTCWSVTMSAVLRESKDPDGAVDSLRNPIQSGTGYRFNLEVMEGAEGRDQVYGYSAERLAPDEVRSFTPGIIIHESSPQPIELPFILRFFGKEYRTIFPYNRGAIFLDGIIDGSDMRWRYSERPLIVPALMRKVFHEYGERAEKQKMTRKIVENQMVISWFMGREYSGYDEGIEFHVVLSHSAIEWHFVKFPVMNEPPIGQVEIPVWYSGLLPGKPADSKWISPENVDLGAESTFHVPANGFVQDNTLDARKFIHGYAAPFAVLGLVGGAFVCWLMNLFLYQIISKPLASMESTLRRINQGEIGLRAQVFFSDEFGYFAKIFNRMADSIQNNTRALIQEKERLEEQVDLRKEELMRQIQERSRLASAHESNQQKMTMLLSNLTGAAYQKSVDEYGYSLIYMSEGCSAVFGYTADELSSGKRRGLHSLIHEDDRKEYEKQLLKSRDEGVSYSEQYRFRRMDGEWRWALDEGRPVFYPNGEFRFFEGLINDVTQENQAKLSLELAKQKAESANRAKGVFVGYMSHEIRTPLNAILGYSQLLLREPTLPANYREPVEMIEISGAHLMALIDDILDFSKIQSGQSELRPVVFDIVSLCKILDGWFVERCASKGLRWQVVGPAAEKCFVHGDESKLRQVLLNLLSNSIKFSNEGTVTLRVAENPDKPGIWRFEVSDTGPGIPESAQQKIFEPFVQHDAGISKGGTGLGLAIASRHVELMGGKLQLESKVDKGATFYFEIALSKLDAGPDTLSSKKSLISHPYAVTDSEKVRTLPEGVTLRAMIVDDVQVNREVMQESLARIGVQTWSARDGQEAIELLADLDCKIDVIFMDIRMPRMDGKTALKKIQSQLPGEKPSVIAFSASTLEQEQKELLDIGFDGFFPKPFRFVDLESLIAKLINAPLVVGGNEAGIQRSMDVDGERDWIDVRSASGEAEISASLLNEMMQAIDYGQITELDRLLNQYSEQGDLQGKWVSKNRKHLQRLELSRLKEELQKLRVC